MRIGIMGLHDGHIRGMLRSALATPNAELVGIVEADDRLYEEYTKERPIPRYPSLDEMISEARPQLILEGLNHKEKTELVVKAARAGVHLLLDKPLCHSLDDWRRMREAVRAGGIQVSMWFTSRSYKPFVKLREHVQNGDLGELVSFVSTHPHMWKPYFPAWYDDPQVYTGVFHDLACHGVDQIRWLSGAEFTGVHAVSSCIGNRPEDRVDHVQASFTLSSGGCAVVTADWLTPTNLPAFGDTRFIVMGTKGSAHLRAYAGDHLLLVSEELGIVEPDLSMTPQRPFVEELIEALERGEDPFISTEDVFAVAKACLIAERSAARGGEFLAISDEIIAPSSL